MTEPVQLVHEIWREPDGCTSLVMAGPQGDEFRQKHLHPEAELIGTILGSSYFEAMTRYYEFMEWGEYRTEWPQDKELYPPEWAELQQPK